MGTERCHVVRIGTKPSNKKTKLLKPMDCTKKKQNKKTAKIKGLIKSQNSFRKEYIMIDDSSKEEEEVNQVAGIAGASGDTSSAGDDHGSTTKAILGIRLQNNLFGNLVPLLFENQGSSFTMKVYINMEEVEKVLLGIVSDLQLEKEKELTEILGTEQVELSPNTEAKKQSTFPTMIKYGLPLGDPRVHRSLLRDLHRMNYKTTKKRTMYVNFGNNMDTALVTIPLSKDLERIKRNDRVHHWFPDLVDAISGGDEDDRVETVTMLLVFIGEMDQYRESFLSAVEELGLSYIPKIGPSTTFAIQSSSNLNFTQMRELSKHLRTVLGSSRSSPEQKV